MAKSPIKPTNIIKSLTTVIKILDKLPIDNKALVKKIIDDVEELIVEFKNPMEKRKEIKKEEEIIAKKNEEIRTAKGKISYFKKNIHFKKGDILKLETELKYCDDDKKREELEKKLIELKKDLEYSEGRLTHWIEYKEFFEQQD